VAVRSDRFLGDLVKFSRVGVDSAILIYHLDNTAPYAALTESLFASVAGGTVRAILSTVSVTEALVKPFAEQNTDRIEAFGWFLRALPNSVLVAPDHETAKDAARLRARYGVRTPDALLLATARQQRARAFVTNDSKLSKVRGEEMAIVVLDDYLA
jgi:predicted nucleic acid-binding protein